MIIKIKIFLSTKDNINNYNNNNNILILHIYNSSYSNYSLSDLEEAHEDLNVGRWLSVGGRGDDHVLIYDELGG
jgi:hypothetical protein